MKLLSLLELFVDKEHLRHDNFLEVGQSRLWNTSKIGPFAANVAFALMRCGAEHSVALFVNEILTNIPKCGDSLWCPWDTFLKLHPSLRSCEFHSICDTQEETENLPDDRF